MKGQRSQYLWIDSTILPIYKNQRIQRYKSLARIASCGKNSMGWFYGDRGYISQDLKSKFKDHDIDLMTDHRRNMQSIQLGKSDEYHLKQHNKIETLFSLLKGQYNLVTSKARSIHDF